MGFIFLRIGSHIDLMSMLGLLMGLSASANVRINEALVVVRKRLEEDDTLPERTSILTNDIMELLTFCVITTAFQLREEYYQQTEGMAMGSPLSPVVANIYMEHFRGMALEMAPLKPSV